MIVVGIDPGATGGICVVTGDRSQSWLFNSSTVESDAVEALLAAIELKPTTAVIEKVSAYRGQGVSSAFTFGLRAGLSRGVIIANKIPLREVTPKTWQKLLGLTIAKDAIAEDDPKKRAYQRKKLQKEKSYNLARMLYPNLKITKENADAVMLAEYALRILQGK